MDLPIKNVSLPEDNSPSVINLFLFSIESMSSRRLADVIRLGALRSCGCPSVNGSPAGASGGKPKDLPF